MKRLILILISLIVPFLSYSQATVPFVCSDGFGYTFNGTPSDVYEVNLQTGVNTLRKDNVSTGAVSVGYNPVDNFIWAVDKVTANLVKIDKNFNITNYPSNLPKNIHVADVDSKGIFYGLSGTKLYRYDLNTNPPTQLSTINLNSNPGLSDFSFNPLDGFIYGVQNDGDIVKINPTNGTVTIVRRISGITNQTYGACYFDGDGTLYISGNSNGNIYKISNTGLSSTSSESAVLFSTGPTAGANDGARCASAPLCKVSTTIPSLSQSSITNTCESSTVNLGSVSASNTPDGTSLTWHTASPVSNGNKISNVSSLGAGTYFASFYDAQNNCYSANDISFVVTINPVPVTPTGVSVSNSSVCANAPVNLIGSCSVGTLTWYEGSTSGTLVGTGSPFSVTPAATKSYVAVCKTTSPVCVSNASSPVTITVNPKPSAPVLSAGSSTICDGTSTTITAQGCSGTVNWSTGATGSSITVNPNLAASPATYSATCTNSSGCVSLSSSQVIQVVSSATYFSVDKVSVCSGSSVTITVGGCAGTKGYFADGSSINTSSNNSFVHSPVSSTIYTVKCDGANVISCANNSTQVSVAVISTPSALTVSGATTICKGASATLTASACTGGTIIWSNSETGSSINVSPSTTTDYTATCLKNGCESSASNIAKVTVELIPTSPTGTSSGTICQGESATLAGSCASGTLKWYNELGLTTIATMPVSPSSTKTYYGVCQSANCKSSDIQATVTVNAKPNAPTGLNANPSTICSGESTFLSGNCTNGSSLVWYTTSGLITPLVSSTVKPTNTTIYYGSCEKAGCKSTPGTITVTVNASPAIPTVTSASTNICSGSSYALTGSCASGSTLQWFLGVVDDSSLEGTGSSVSVSPTETSTYVSNCKSNSNSCQSLKGSSVTINVVDTPVAPTSVTVSKSQICSGESITLSGNCVSPSTLKWYTDAGLTAEVSSPQSPTSNTTYYGSCVIGVCKSSVVSKDVNVTTTPAQPAGLSATSTSICQNQSTTLSASCASGTLTWYTDAALTSTLASTSVQPSSSTTYYASCVNGACKSDAANIIINVTSTPPTPTGLTVSDLNVCSGESFNLTGSCSTGTLKWYSDAALTTAQNPTAISISSTKTYYAVCEVGVCKGISVPKTVEVSELPDPPTIVPSSRNLCLGFSLTLSATGCTGSVTWYLNGSVVQTSATLVLTPTVAGVNNYQAVCTNTGTTCASPLSGTSVITVIAPPVDPSISISNNSICEGSSVTLTSQNCSGTTNWFLSGSPATNIGSTNPLTHTPAASGSYFATCTSSSSVVECESGSSAPVNFTVKPLPTKPTISTTKANICAGENTTISAVCATGSAIWSNGETGASITVSPQVTTIYTAKCILNNCESLVSDNQTITVTAIPTAPTAISAGSICAGASSTLEATCASGTIKWYSDAALTTLVTSPVSPSVTTTYYGSCQLNSCNGPSGSVIVNVTPIPAAPASLSASSTSICNGLSTQLSASCASGALKWYGEAGLLTELGSNTVSPTATKTYYASCVNNTCKSASSSIEITVIDLPAAPTLSTSKSQVCSGEDFTLTASGCTGTLLWSDAATAAVRTLSLTSTKTYTATCKNASGCISLNSATLSITVTDIPALPIISANKYSICPTESVILSGSGCSGTLNWYKSDAPTTSLGTTATLTVNPASSSAYFATCTTVPVGCVSDASDNVAITVKALPVITDIVTPVCQDGTKSLVAFQTSGNSASVVSVSGGYSAVFDSDGRETDTGNDTRRVWVIEGVANATTINVTVNENGCETLKSYTTSDCSAAIAFPVDILWFKGIPSKDIVKLQWLVANESEIAKFEVQRSADAKGFETLGAVGAKNIKDSHLYTFDDTKPKQGINYYKIKVTEFSGNVFYSKIIGVDFKETAEFIWKVSPNPIKLVDNKVIISTNGAEEVLGIDIYTSTGVRLKSAWAMNVTNQYSLSIGNLPPAIYLIKVSTLGGISTKRLVVEK